MCTLMQPATMARGSRIGFLVLLTAMAAPLAGCGGDRVVADATTPPDYHVRHPIVVAEADYALDLFPTGTPGGLDARSSDRLRDFARRYAEIGHGQITVLVPRGGANDLTVAASLGRVRDVFSGMGARGVLAVSSYPVADPGLAAPLRLSFEGLKGRLSHRCGDWPNDLASGSTAQGWENKTYWNFGCANQSMLAAQVADPRDLAGPRGERPADTSMRIRAIESVRKGVDPGTKWEVKNSGIGAVGSGQ
ncbi:MAG: CpaD family pilus assembly protein [Beijerinckiaceae bacterium]